MNQAKIPRPRKRMKQDLPKQMVDKLVDMAKAEIPVPVVNIIPKEDHAFQKSIPVPDSLLEIKTAPKFEKLKLPEPPKMEGALMSAEYIAAILSNDFVTNPLWISIIMGDDYFVEKSTAKKEMKAVITQALARIGDQSLVGRRS